MKYESAEGDRQLLLAEMKRLREQYEDLIKQMEQTQAIIDKQQVSPRVLLCVNIPRFPLEGAWRNTSFTKFKC